MIKPYATYDTYRKHGLRTIVRLFLCVLISVSYGSTNKAFSNLLSPTSPMAQQVRISTPLILSQKPYIVLEKGILSLDDGANVDAGNLGTNRLMPLSPEWIEQLNNSDAKTIILDEGVISIGKNNVHTVQPTTHLQLPQTSLRTIFINNSALLIRNKEAKTSKIHINSMKGTISWGKKLSLKGTVRWHSQDVALNAVADLADLTKDKITAIPLKLNLESKYTKAQFQGALYGDEDIKLQGGLDLNVQDLRYFSSWLGHHLPTGPGLNLFKAKGQLLWQNEHAHLTDSLFELDGNKAQGTVTLNTQDAKPKLSGTIALNTLDLTKYIKERETFLKIPDPLGLKPDNSFDLTLLDAFDIDLRISAKKLIFGKLISNDNALSLFQRKGQAIVDIAQANICGGVTTGNMKVNTNYREPRWQINMLLKNVRTDECLTYLVPNLGVKGHADIKLFLTSHGNSFAALKKQAKGKAEISASEGSTAQIDVNKLFKDKKIPTYGWKKFQDNSTQLQKLTAKFVINQGKAVSEFFTVETPSQLLSGKGLIDLSGGKLDWLISSKNKKSDKNPNCIAIEGDLKNPRVSSANQQAQRPTGTDCPSIKPAKKAAGH